jgi:hypothetical protein
MKTQEIVGLVFILLVVAAGPILIIWSWNTLFGSLHTIPYTLSTWAAVVFFAGFMQAKVKIDK